MAPPRETDPMLPFKKDEKVLCFHMDLLYEAKVIDLGPPEDDEEGEILYKIHYKGWKSTWDDWVSADRIRKFNEENLGLARQLHAQARALMTKSTTGGAAGANAKGGKKALPTAPGKAAADSARGSEERAGPTPVGAPTPQAVARGPRRNREMDLETEDAFFNRPSIKLPMSDLFKGLLVDDWENITRLNQLVPIPHEKPVSKILDDYLDYERLRREEGTASRDILEETVAGLRLYFNKALGHILLYRFERPQWHEVLRQIREANENSTIRAASDAYGAEHLARLLCSLEELIAQTNMDQQSVNRLREELSVFISWFENHHTDYFVSQYESPSQEYIEKARSF